jgi:hypothetical protein
MTTAVVPGGGPLLSAAAGIAASGLCTLSWQGTVFTFRTNPNEIWWTYELITHTEETYGGRVVQILGTKLGDLSVKVECGNGGWDYLMMVVNYLRDLLTAQRNGVPAQFSYTGRNWLLGVYAMSVPFGDQVTATTREIELNFKIQQDITGVIGQATLDAAFTNIAVGTYTPGMSPHNQYNDGAFSGGSNLSSAPENPSGPTYNPAQPTNSVDSNPLGNDILGANLVAGIPVISNIPGLSSIIGGT